MTGDATAAGTHYQAAVCALISAHILAGKKLGWFTPDDDVPAAVWCETGGPGDDIRIEFASGHVAELQAKHRLSGGASLDEVVAKMQAGFAQTGEMPLALVLSRGSSKTVLHDFAHDLGRLRAKRESDINDGECRRLLRADPASRKVLENLRVIAVDVDQADEPEHKQALSLLSSQVLADKSHDEAALNALFRDASAMCARRERRDRDYLVSLLNTNGTLVAAHRPTTAASGAVVNRVPNLAQQLDAKAPFDGWNDIASGLYQGEPEMRVEDFDRLLALRQWVGSGNWPTEEPDVRSAYERFRSTLGAFLDFFIEKSYLWPGPELRRITAKPPDAGYVSDDNYSEYAAALKQNCQRLDVLFGDLTNAANSLIRQIRSDVDATFRAGALDLKSQ
jgi:hypothetical protein